MMRTFLCIAGVACVGLLFAPASDARSQPGWHANRALAIAQHVWKPACGELRLAYGYPESVDLPEYADEWAWHDDCTININRRNHYEFEEFCSVVLHGGGHAAGLGHSDNPRSVMYAEPIVVKQVGTIDGRTTTRWDGVDRRCLNRGRPFLEKHGLIRARTPKPKP